jgi:U4/U6 small nuclear ribonucleoprotein PRP4
MMQQTLHAPSGSSDSTEHKEIFYTFGSSRLLSFRKMIAKSSHVSASRRLEGERVGLVHRSISYNYWDSIDVVSNSQVGDSRPLTAIALSPSISAVAVASWSGDISVFSTESSARKFSTLQGHIDRCNSIVWAQDVKSRVQLISGGVDKTIKVWSSNDDSTELQKIQGMIPSATIEGHELRVNKVAIHPNHANLVASSSDDTTMRLWDIEREEEVLLQEGHFSEVFGLAIHPDGSLVATGDRVGVVRIWDLRSGKSVLYFDRDHVDQVVTLDFSPNGYFLGSGSGDNTVRVFDLRKRQNTYILTSHTKLVSAVKFAGQVGDTLMSAGYDCVARIWRTNDFKIIKNLPLHETRITAGDISSCGRIVATACYDRTFKLWSNPSQSHGLKLEVS